MAERAVHTVELLDNLADLEGSNEPEIRDVALKALQVADPMVQEAALRVLAPFGTEQAVVDAALPMLLGDVPSVERAAAEAIRKFPASLIAQQFKSNHDSDVIDFHHRSPDVTRWGFKAPPGATGYPPGDTAQAVALRISEPFAKVVAFYAPGAVQALTPDEMGDYSAKKGSEGTQDMSMYFALVGLLEPTAETARAFILERKGSIDTRVAYVYDQPVIHQTVIVLAWSNAAGLPPRFREH